MIREKKAQIIDELSDKLSNVSFFYLADASGLTVAEINKFRGICYEKGLEYKVYKNTLVRKALEKQEGDYSELYDVLKGTTGIIFSPEAGNLPAKAIKEYRTGSDKPILKAASIDGDFFIGDEHLKSLAELKSKAELIGEIIGLLQSPAKNVISGLQGGGNKLSGILKTLSERA
ncbi:MAG: 50S ribosomal protein L10 [Cyclobacteriaceae bacterium]